MTTNSTSIDIDVQGDTIGGTFLAPASETAGVLFIHGWGGNQNSDLTRARRVAGLGCLCLTFDLRGHAETHVIKREKVTREDNLYDIFAAYDRLAEHPEVDPSHIAVVGSSYGGYLSAILTASRPVKWLALQVPALYPDEHWDRPKAELDRAHLNAYRRSPVSPSENRALEACSRFEGDVLIVEAEHDEVVPHPTIKNYRDAFARSHSLTHRIIDGADHGLTDDEYQLAYTAVLVNWMTEMVVGGRI